MNKPRGESEQTKLLLLNSALGLFAQRGYQATTLSLICARAKVSKGSVYFHFKNKEHLFIEVLERDRESWLSRWEKAYDDMPADSTTRDFMRVLAEYYAEDYRSPLIPASKEFAMQGALDEALMARILKLSTKHHPLLRKMLVRGMERGEIKAADPDHTTLVIASMLDGLGSLVYSTDTDAFPALYAKAIDIILDGIIV